ncbi:hypothetical protein F383_02533 [Gossypium arboreum]|uniref:Uncharacterized protein n=1 Tax=Gossypium arboreum TaxID=29729 RepID=A0A0B0P376_GOSAR|nr:hypothetical protein F383_02533 [Gossypium arboreum]
MCFRVRPHLRRSYRFMIYM